LIEYLFSIGILALIIFVMLWYMSFLEKSHEQRTNSLYDIFYQKERQWQEERQQLLDRIQSPSFAEYKQAEVKVMKAQKKEEPEIKFHLE
jgi:hypothetical protein